MNRPNYFSKLAGSGGSCCSGSVGRMEDFKRQFQNMTYSSKTDAEKKSSFFDAFRKLGERAAK